MSMNGRLVMLNDLRHQRTVEGLRIEYKAGWARIPVAMKHER